MRKSAKGQKSRIAIRNPAYQEKIDGKL